MNGNPAPIGGQMVDAYSREVNAQHSAALEWALREARQEAAEIEVKYRRQLATAGHRARALHDWELKTTVLALIARREIAALHLMEVMQMVDAYSREVNALLGSIQYRLGDRAYRLVEGRLIAPRVSAGRPAEVRKVMGSYARWRAGFIERRKRNVPEGFVKRVDTYIALPPSMRSKAEMQALMGALQREHKDFHRDLAFLRKVFDDLNAHMTAVRKSGRFKLGRLIMAQAAKVRALPDSAGYLHRMDGVMAQWQRWKKTYDKHQVWDKLVLPDPPPFDGNI